MRTADPQAVSSLVTPERLREFFAPRSIALVGASDTSGWARFVAASAQACGFSGPLIPVHPVHPTVFGRPAVRSLRDLPEPADLAFVLAPAQAVESVLDDAGAAGVRNAIVLAAGYREAGEQGRALEQRMIAALGDAAAVLDGALRALEVNPLWVNGDHIEALDVLVVTGSQNPGRTELSR
jgi:acetate---CoA ligase (ADP-forming)